VEDAVQLGEFDPELFHAPAAGRAGVEVDLDRLTGRPFAGDTKQLVIVTAT
jgi:hypothetical protein